MAMNFLTTKQIDTGASTEPKAVRWKLLRLAPFSYQRQSSSCRQVILQEKLVFWPLGLGWAKDWIVMREERRALRNQLLVIFELVQPMSQLLLWHDQWQD